MHLDSAIASLTTVLVAVSGCDVVARTRSSTTTAAPSGSSGTSANEADFTETRDGQVTNAYLNMPPYPEVPIDPWAAVAGDQPRRMSHDAAVAWSVRDNDFACTSAHDHCFAPDLWLIESDDSAKRSSYRTSAAYGLGPEGPVLPLNSKNGGLPADPFTAFRTVPATRKNLVPGALVFALTFPRTQLSRGSDVFDATWNTGVVDRVDWDLGFVYLEGQDRNYWITATRTAALSWRPGGKVEIVGGRARNSLAVGKDEVILPDLPQP